MSKDILDMTHSELFKFAQKTTRENDGLQYEVDRLQKERDLYADEDRRVTEIAGRRKQRIEELEKENQELQEAMKEIMTQAFLLLQDEMRIKDDYLKLRKFREDIQLQNTCERCDSKFNHGQDVVIFLMPFCGEECRDIHLKELGWAVDDKGYWTGGKLK